MSGVNCSEVKQAPSVCSCEAERDDETHQEPDLYIHDSEDLLRGSDEAGWGRGILTRWTVPKMGIKPN